MRDGGYNDKITIADVAEALGVSKTTVSRAISGKGRIGGETKQRVLQYIERNGYQPNVIAKSLAQSKTYNIAMLQPVGCNIAELPFFQNCMYGVCRAAVARDYDVLVVYQSGGAKETLERIISNHKIDGILISRTLMSDETVDYVKGKHIPLVAIGSSPDEELIQVDNDHLSACRELTGYLLRQGAQRMALIGGNRQHVVTRTRYQGFAEAFHEADIPILAELVYLDVDEESRVEEIVDDVMAKKADCIVCMDDMICSRVLECLERRRVLVPEQIQVASFYNSLLIGNRVPQVTTLTFDVAKLGVTACDTLLDVIEGKNVKRKQLLPYYVSIKGSTK